MIINFLVLLFVCFAFFIAQIHFKNILKIYLKNFIFNSKKKNLLLPKINFPYSNIDFFTFLFIYKFRLLKSNCFIIKFENPKKISFIF